MIELQNLSKQFSINGKTTTIAQNINATFPSRTSVALMGRNGAGKSSLLRMIAGTMAPDSGRIISTGTISWPVGFAGSFHGDMTGLQNIRFIGRIYGVDTDELSEFVRSFAEIGHHFYLPVRSYSSGMKSRLAFGVSMAINFDTYLVDEVTAVGDAIFREKSLSLFQDRISTRSAIVVNHNIEALRNMCDRGAILENGNLIYYDDLEEAIAHHKEIVVTAKRASKNSNTPK